MEIDKNGRVGSLIFGRGKLVVAGLLMMVFCGGVARADDSCKALYDALTKVVEVPVHIYTTTVAGYNKNVPTSNEMIYSGGRDGAIYVMAAGRWTRTKMTGADMMSKQEENRRTAKDTCHVVREEAVNGEAATVYSTHSDKDGNKIDATVWISKSKGLPLKEEMEMDVGGGAGKTHISMRYEYADVKPPAV
jgi:hypothetical protein